MSEDRVITHAEALRQIDAQIDEKVYLAFLLTPGNPEDPENPLPVFHMIAPLRNRLAPKPPRLEPDRGFYEVGDLMFLFAPMTGTIHLRDNGVDFRVAEGVSIRIAWRGSKEIGDWQPDPESLGRLNRKVAKASRAHTPERELPKALRNCPRCGKDHENITWNTFARPMKRDERTISNHWTLCPDNGEPIIREVFGEIVSRDLTETGLPAHDEKPQD